ncbi:hypothetical protein A2U01_0053679, partial [Trifolium medium]|nr:hypothetical protein [Trifolium medium]
NEVPGTPKNTSGPEKDRSPENVMPGNAYDTNTVANTPSDGSVHTKPDVVEINDQTSEDNLVEEVPATSMAKRLRSNTGKGVATASQQATTPSKGKKAATPKHVKYDPPRSSSKVTFSSAKGKKGLKRKEPLSSYSEFEEETVEVTTGGS